MCSRPVSNQNHQRQCKFLSYMFYQAVRDRTPVWMLEDMRIMECFYWEENASLRAYSPSEALLYAVVHDHLPYAQYLLSRYPLEALEVPGDRFCCCPSSAPHLTMAVRYDREDILGLILKIANRLPDLKSYINRKGCFHVEDGKTPLHLACELTRAETVLMLLGSGASAKIADSQGLTPLDIILQQIWASKANSEPNKLCANHLLLFMSSLQFKMKRALEDNATEWKELLGEEQYNYLSGRVPATLTMLAMQCIFKCLPPSRFPGSIKELPIPHSLKPLPFAKPVMFSLSRSKMGQKGGRKHPNP